MRRLTRLLATPLGEGAQAIGICAVVALLTFGTDGSAGIDRATTWLILGVYAISVGFLWGHCGLVSFGHAAFFGLGAYAYAWLTTDILGINMHSVGSVLGPFLGMFLAGLLALAFGYFLFYGNIVGAFFSIVCMALSFMLETLARYWTPVLGGQTGIPDVPPISIEIGSLHLDTRGALAGYVTAAVAVFVVVVGLRLVLKSSFGVMLDGVRDNEERFAYLGGRTQKIKLIGFVMAGIIAGLAGSVYASEARFVSSDLIGTLLSIEAVIWVAVGGRRSILGMLLGTLVVRGVGSWLSDVSVNYWLIVLGVLFIAIVMGGSSGLVGLGRWILAKGGDLAARNR